ncbi:integrase/recombinase, partial [mine drainage metagenome]
WLLFHNVDFRQFPKLRRAYQAESLSRERIPTPEQLRLILGALSPRGRVCALLMAHSGLRPGTLGNDGGTDGLTLGDLPELRTGGRPRLTCRRGDGRFSFRFLPGLSKTAQGYVTFGTPEAADAILSYLGERQAEGEKLTPASPLVALTAAGCPEHRGKGSRLVRDDQVGRDRDPEGAPVRPTGRRQLASLRAAQLLLDPAPHRSDGPRHARGDPRPRPRRLGDGIT